MKTRTVMFPAVALLFAVAVVSDLAVSGTGVRFYRDLLFLSTCAPLAVISFRDRMGCSAPDFLTITGILAGLAFAWFVPVQDKTADAVLQILSIHAKAQQVSLAESILGALLPSCSLWLLGWLFERLKHKEGLGFGAVKTVGMIGAFLGTGGALATIVLGSCLGSIFGILYIKLIGEDTKTYRLPFAGILAGTSVVVLLYSR
jgi:prepilin signal peptidase PulO-like enzyme (type II secretory pathway)